jgi:branched-chain amino acid transport system permease protein
MAGNKNDGVDVRKTVLIIAIAAVLLALPLFFSERYIFRIMINIMLFAALGCAWNIIGGYAGQLSLGHAAFLSMGAYTTGLLMLHFNAPPWAGVVPGVILAALVAYFLGEFVLRLRGPYLALSTLAFGEIVRILLLHFTNFTGGPLGVTIPFNGTNIWRLQFATEHVNYCISLGLLALCIYVGYRIHNSRMGYYLQAIRENQDAAEHLGIPVATTKNLALVISAMLTAVLGGFYLIFMTYIDPHSVAGWHLSIEIVLVAIIGGVGTVWGPVIGACILVPLMEISNFVFGGGRAGASMLIYAIILIIVVLFSPKGLITLVPRLEGIRSE